VPDEEEVLFALTVNGLVPHFEDATETQAEHDYTGRRAYRIKSAAIIKL